MTFIDRRGFLALAASAAFLISSSTGSAKTILNPGDESATVTIAGRPLSGPGNTVAAFTRGGVLYVGLEELTRVVTGTITKAGDVITITSFRGAPDSKTAVFTVGSKVVTVAGKSATLQAPVIEAYAHRPYVPLSFFGTSIVRTKMKESPDHRSGEIIPPADY